MKKICLVKGNSQILSENYLTRLINPLIVRKAMPFAVMIMTVLFAACEKEKAAPDEDLIKAQTSLRLVHSSFISSLAAVDLYVDDVKLNTSAPVQFSGSTTYFPIGSGSRKVTVKYAGGGGATVADTTINIGDGKQYSLFIKDRSWVTEGTLVVVPLNTHIVAAVDNSTSAPADGKAKVRFVNTTSQPLNSQFSPITYYTINAAGSPSPTTVITQTLGGDNTTFASEYSSFDAGQITFRAQSVSPSIADLTTTLEAGKLYTLYVVSTEHSVRTPTKSPLSLKIIPNN